MENFPYLTETEFDEASRHLCDLLTHVNALEYKHCSLDDGTTYVVIEQTTPVNHSFVQSQTNELNVEDHVQHTEVDPECLLREKPEMKLATVEYHIVLSPVYAVPVLYFTMTIDSMPASLDQVYQHLILDGDELITAQLEASIRNVSVCGAISQGDHPVLGRPFWFIHPCETAALLQQWGEQLPLKSDQGNGVNGLHFKTGLISIENYLQIWLGIIGSTVGFYLPIEAFTSQQVEKLSSESNE